MQDKELLQIVKDAVRGEEGAFERLCEKKGRDILYICIRLMKNREDAEDTTQDILLYIREHIHELQHPEAFMVWLYRVINGVCDRTRRRKRKMTVTFEHEIVYEERSEFLPEEFMEDVNRRETVLQILDSLPYKQRVCMLMFYYERFSYQEIANALSITYKDVANAIYRGKKKMIRTLERDPVLKKYLKKIYSAAPVPILAQILAEDLRTVLEPGCMEPFIKVLTGSAGTAAWAARSGIRYLSGAQSSGSVSTVSGSMAVKVSVGLAATAGAAVIGANVYMNNTKPEQPEPAPAAEEAEEAEEPVVVNEEPEELISEPERMIDTLEDMIGEDDAGVLRRVAEQEAVSGPQAETFLEDIGLEAEEIYVQGDIGQTDTLYAMEEQGKLLMAIIRLEQEGETAGLAWRFTDAAEEMPRSFNIEFAFDEWRGF